MKRGKAFGRSAVVLAAGLALTVAAACGTEDSGNGNGSDNGSGNGNGDGASDEPLQFGLVEWGEDIVVTELWNQVLQAEGHPGIETTTLAPGIIFAALAGQEEAEDDEGNVVDVDADLDGFVDYWLPVTHKNYQDQYGDSIENLGTWNESAALTFAVPTYVDDSIQSIADLADNAEMFDDRVVGIDPGSGLAGITDDAVFPTYGLDEAGFDHVTSTTEGMLSELGGAYDAEEPIVVTLWRPHWAYDAWDLRDLEDPELTLGEVETISMAVRRGFSDDYPEVAQWLTDFEMSDDELYSLMFIVNDPDGHAGDVEAGVTEWIETNADFVSNMTG